MSMNNLLNSVNEVWLILCVLFLSTLASLFVHRKQNEDSAPSRADFFVASHNWLTQASLLYVKISELLIWDYMS